MAETVTHIVVDHERYVDIRWLEGRERFDEYVRENPDACNLVPVQPHGQGEDCKYFVSIATCIGFKKMSEALISVQWATQCFGKIAPDILIWEKANKVFCGEHGKVVVVGWEESFVRIHELFLLFNGFHWADDGRLLIAQQDLGLSCFDGTGERLWQWGIQRDEIAGVGHVDIQGETIDIEDACGDSPHVRLNLRTGKPIKKSIWPFKRG